MEIFTSETLAEILALWRLFWPVTLYQFFNLSLLVITVIVSGHLGRKELVGISLGETIISALVFTLGNGLGTTIDTLASQSYGAKNKLRVGIIIQRAILILGMACFPVWGLFLNTEALVMLIVKDEEIARIAGVYVTIYIPIVPVMFLYFILIRFMEIQETVRPAIAVAFVACIMEIICNAILVYGFGVGFVGTVISGVMGNVTLTVGTIVVIIWLNLHKDTWGGWSKECLLEWGQFYKLALPGAVMFCISYWAMQSGMFLIGTLEDEIMLAAQGILSQVVNLLYTLPYSLSVAASVRVGIYLGRGNPEKAKTVSKIVLYMSYACGLLVTCFLFVTRSVIGYLFTSSKVVADLFQFGLIAYSFFLVFNWINLSMQGILRGTGKIAFISIVQITTEVFYFLPLCFYLTLYTEIGLIGFWLPFGSAKVLKVLFCLILILKVNWKEESVIARRNAGVETECDGSTYSSSFKLKTESSLNDETETFSWEDKVRTESDNGIQLSLHTILTRALIFFFSLATLGMGFVCRMYFPLN